GRDRSAPAADPLRHREPARGRAPGAGVPRGPARGRGVRGDADRAHRSAPEPRRAPARPRRRAGAVPALARRHGAGDAVGVDARPVVGRRGRRLHLGPGRARHEVADRGRGRRRDQPRRVGLEAGTGRPARRRGRRRGDRRRGGRGVDLRAPPRPRALRLPAQRGRRRGPAVRRPALLRRLHRREGRLPVQALHRRRRGARLDPEDRRQRAAEGRAPAAGVRRHDAGVRSHRRPARAARRPRPRPAERRSERRAHAPAGEGPGPRDPRRADARRDVRADEDPRVGQDQRAPVAGRHRRRLPRPAGPRRGARAPAHRGGARRRRVPLRVLRAGRGQRVAGRLAAHGRHQGLGRAHRARGRGRPDDPPGLHRLADVPKRLPRLRGLRLLPPLDDDRARGGAAHPQRRRADPGGRPRPRDRLLHVRHEEHPWRV
ncbi:MAG: Peptidase M20, partial [uncultured Solirubrobacteraceae bacterium]